MHYSVLFHEVMEWAQVQPAGVWADFTTGMGGHTRGLAERAMRGRVYACDRDAESLAQAAENLADLKDRIEFIHTPFSRAADELRRRGVDKLDGVLVDLGVSRVQLTSGPRGFSLMEDGPLDMRMDRSTGATAADLVNQLPERELANLLYELADERRSFAIARALVRNRPILTSTQAAEVIARSVPRTSFKIHPATQTFMALRIAVNQEFEEIEALLPRLPDLIRRGGRALVISFHSNEDRIVKQAFVRLKQEGRARILTKHVVKPTDRETQENPASRSAKLRVVEIV